MATTPTIRITPATPAGGGGVRSGTEHAAEKRARGDQCAGSQAMCATHTNRIAGDAKLTSPVRTTLKRA